MSVITLESTDFVSSNSYAKVARNHALFLEQAGYKLILRSRERPHAVRVGPGLARHLAQLHRRPAAGLRIRYACPKGLCEHPHGIFMTPFETAELSPRWVRAAKTLRMLFVHCETSRRQFLTAGLPAHQVSVVHHGYDPHIYRPDAKPMERSPKFTFLYVGHFNPRKCIGMLIHAFCQTFRSDDPVRLLLVLQSMQANSGDLRRIQRILQQYPGSAEVSLRLQAFNDGLPEEQMGSLYRSADCLVYPSMGEGFGLPPLEAKACGLEVITTRCSGMLDFLDDDSAHFIDVAEMRPEPNCESITSEYRGLKFWIPDQYSLRRQLRAVFDGNRKPKMPVGWTWRERLSRLPSMLERLADNHRYCTPLLTISLGTVPPLVSAGE